MAPARHDDISFPPDVEGHPRHTRPARAKSPPGGLCARREQLVKQLILAHLGESLDVSELAKACALSRSHFSRAFKCTTGLPPLEWIRRQRIARAKHLIMHSELTLTEIGIECGFCDQAHFCNIFTRSVGVNPMTWRHHQLRDATPSPHLAIATTTSSARTSAALAQPAL